MTTDPRVDAYIAKSADFAQPILRHIREVVHSACPDVVEEMKWSFPHFSYKGMLCSMASFKAHCAFGFWKGSLVIPEGKDTGMGQLGKITSLDDLPSKRELSAYVKKAMQLNDDGVPAPYVTARRAAAKTKVAKPLVIPPELTAALKRNKKALAAFGAFSPSHKREYAEWITEAKREETRERRVAQAVEMIAEGKSRNWKYEK